MKTPRFYAALPLLALASLFSSCKKDESPAPGNNIATVPLPRGYVLGESNANDADNMAISAVKRDTVKQRPAGETCSPEVTYTKTDTDSSIVINFNTGCAGEDTVTRSGKILINYKGNYFEQGSSMTITFENYKANGRQLEGTRTFTNMGLNGDSKMYWKVEASNMKLTLLDGSSRSWNSSRTRVWSAGGATPENADDDEFTINGTAAGSFSDGTTFTASLTNLVRASACRWIASGILDATINGKDKVKADFGDGSCDNVVLITWPDNSQEKLLLK